MATMTKYRARKPLAEGTLARPGWSNYQPQGERFIMSVGDYRLHMTRAEAEKLVADMRERLDDPELREAAGL